MTRINVVPPEELTRQHLIAEYRELPRVFALIRKAYVAGEHPNDAQNPLTYRLGTGHVRFFYNKVSWLVERFYELTNEMRSRGYHVGYPDPPSTGCPITDGWNRPFTPSEADKDINRARIAERLEKPRKIFLDGS